MQEELDPVLRKIKNRKAAELDEIPPPEVWKDQVIPTAYCSRHCNAVYNQNPNRQMDEGMHPPLL